MSVGFPEKCIKLKMGKRTDFSLLSPHSFLFKNRFLILQPIPEKFAFPEGWLSGQNSVC